MSDLLRVTDEDIQRLNDRDLTELLRLLLHLEAKKYGLSTANVSVPLSIDVPDGGEDGAVEWDPAIVARTDWLPKPVTCFQVKATNMPPEKCKEEIFEAAPQQRGASSSSSDRRKRRGNKGSTRVRVGHLRRSG